jgi:hypothetical protein
MTYHHKHLIIILVEKAIGVEREVDGLSHKIWDSATCVNLKQTL